MSSFSLNLLLPLNFLSWLILCHPPSHPGWKALNREPRSLCLFCSHSPFHQSPRSVDPYYTYYMDHCLPDHPTPYLHSMSDLRAAIMSDCGSSAHIIGPDTWHSDYFVNTLVLLLILLDTYKFIIISQYLGPISNSERRILSDMFVSPKTYDMATFI